MVEAKVDRGRGIVATVLVQNGTLRVGDNFIVGNTFGKVRAMFDDRSKAVDEAPPSTPVEVLGLEGLPQSGDMLMVADREKARQIAEYREQRAREATLAKSSKLSLEGLAEQIKTAGMKELPIILKADVQGSAEVLADTLTKLSNEKVKIKILHTGVGAINENDVLLASASNAVIIGFNVRPERKAQELADQEKIDIRLHSIIYELQDQIKKAMSGPAGADHQGNLPGPRRSARDLPRTQSRHRGRLLCARRLDQARFRSSPGARWRAGLQRQDRLAQALQRRCQRGSQWHGVRHQPAELQ